jgi:hypothetical protein
MPSTDGLSPEQRKTTDNLQISVKASVAKFNYKIRELKDRCGGAIHTFGTEDLQIELYSKKEKNSKIDGVEFEAKYYGFRLNFLNPKLGNAFNVKIFPNGDIETVLLGVPRITKSFKGPGLTFDMSAGIGLD